MIRNLSPVGATKTHTTVTPRPELWETFAIVTLAWALLSGFGAYSNLLLISPTMYSAGTSALLIATVVLTPRGLIRVIRVPKPLIFFLGWMVLSYTWSPYRYGWVKETWRDLITLLVVLIVGQLLPVDRFFRVLLHVGYAAIGLICLALAAAPSLAYSAADGLRGGFIHKSPMGSTLILMVALALCVEQRRWVRRGLTTLVVILLILGHTTTGIASILLVLALYPVLVRLKELHATLGRSFRFLIAGCTILFGAAYVALSNALVAFSGKDLTFSKRTQIWAGVIDAVHQRPITGFGWGVWSALWREPATSIVSVAGFSIAETHNAALELLLRLGIVGLVLYLTLLISALRTGLRFTTRNDPAGIFTVLVVAMIVIWGFTEALPVTGAWIGLLGVLAVGRPLKEGALDASPAMRRRLFSPGAAHVD